MATTEINIVARNKAAASLRQVNTQLGAIQGSTQNINNGFSRLRNLVIGVAAALGGVRLARGFLDTAVEVENLGVQLKFITGSATEGAKALDIVTEAASKSSFQLRDMAQAAPLLLTVADSTDELNQLLAITGDIAAASGLSFVETAGQLQRAFSGGIAAADLFRERGVKALLGFQEGVRYNAEQTKDIITTAFENGTVTIAGASQDMANTFTGQISMISDKFFQFQKQVMDAAPFEFLKSVVEVINQDLQANFGNIEDAATNIGQGFVNATKSAILGSARILDAIKPIFDFVRNSISNLLGFMDGLDPTIKAIGIIGFLMVGLKAKLAIIAIGQVLQPARNAIAELLELQAKLTQIALDYTPFLTEERKAIMNQNIKDFKEAADNLRNAGDKAKEDTEDMFDFGSMAIGDLAKLSNEEFDAAISNMGKFEAAAMKMLRRVDDITLKRRELLKASSTDLPDEPEIDKVDKAALEAQKKRQNELLKALGQRVKGHFEALKTEREQELDTHKQRINDLRQFISINTELRRFGNEQIRREEERHAKAMAAIQKREFNEQLDLFKQGEFAKLDLSKISQEDQVGFVKAAGMEILSVMATQNKKAFEIQKRLQIAQAIMNVATGVTKALAQGGIFGPIMAGAIVALGAAQIAAINSQQYQGRRFGGTVGSRESYIVGENGPEIFTPGQVGAVTPMGGSNGPVNVNFSITATDARSVDELLVERRGMITNMVRQAIQERGNKPNF